MKPRLRIKLEYVNGEYILTTNSHVSVFYKRNYVRALEDLERIKAVLRDAKITASFDICLKYAKEIPPRYTKTSNY